MIYVMSDIHGEYEKYLKMLDLIHFSERDSLFILGDIVDRGAKPITTLRDMMQRANVFPTMGNHDFLAWYLLEKISVDITELNYDKIEIDDIQDMLSWIEDGGASTIAEFQKLDIQERCDILEYISEFPLYETIDIGKKTFIMVHAGLGNFRKDKKLSEYTTEELICMRGNPNQKLFEDDSIYIVSGHTPTPLISGKAEIYHGANHIYIDCGACFSSGKLACLCLNTMQEFYI